jgi:hypothetical protein
MSKNSCNHRKMPRTSPRAFLPFEWKFTRQDLGRLLSKLSTPGTPPGTYTITVTATSGKITHSATCKLIVQ